MSTDRPRPLFVMGSKRSGSTLTVHVLNSHPRVFVSHEADTAWILYQARDGMPGSFEPHPLDSAMMMSTTVRQNRRRLRQTLGTEPDVSAIRDAFFLVQDEVLRRWLAGQRRPGGGLWRVFERVGKRPTPRTLWDALRWRPEALPKDDLAWIGDKKHAQHLEPDIQTFLHDHFPGARYIHVVRNPRGVVASMVQAADQWLVQPDYFQGDPARILEQWAVHEEWALAVQARDPDAFLTVRLEDLTADPEHEARRMTDFLGLDFDPTLENRIPKLVRRRDPNAKYADFDLPDVPRARPYLEKYGYA